MIRLRIVAALAAAGAAACTKAPPPVVYQAVPVERRDIVVSAQASGGVEPDTTVEVKSKASGEIQRIMAETGQLVQRGQELVKVDPRTARNALAQAQADLDVARAELVTSTAQKQRSDALFTSQSITQQENETALLAYANATANAIKAQVAVENARIQVEDVDVRAPITGTIIEKKVERGQVIASALSNVSGGTVLMRMADLSLVQVKTLVDETDIGKIQPGMPATVTVDAYPSRPFEGTVLKIEPQADTVQNVTRFPVRVRIQNRDGLLRPGMNTEVEIHVGRRDGVLAIPNASLRTQRDVASAAQVLGISMDQVRKDLAVPPPPSGGGDTAVGGQASLGAATPGGSGGHPAGNTMTPPDGRAIPQATGRSGGGAGGGRSRSSDFQSGGSYIVFVKRGGAPRAANVRTGLTDLDYSEVRSGLRLGDSVLVLPSASLVQSQQEMKQRINNVTGGGLPGMRQQTSAPAGSAGAGGAGGGGGRPTGRGR